MTDVIFLLLIFFMVTSTFVFPTGLEVNLPQSTEQSAVKPMTKVYIDANDSIYASANDEKPQPVTLQELPAFLKLAQQADTTGFIALYADAQVPYGRIVEVLDLGTRSMTKLDVVKALMPDNSDLLAPLGLPAAVTEVSGTLQTEMRQPRYTDLDFNGHVNNTRYLDWCCDALGIDTMRGAYLKHFAVNFDAEVMPMQQIRTELRRLGDDFSYCGFEGDKRHFDVGGLLARQN